ncbi:MAG: monovalent cation/H(+) antiporter subunit G [Gammaproteobacteria bacterium]
MIDLLWSWVGWGLLSIGSFSLLAGGIGLLRMPDFFTRLHAAGVTDTLGAGALLLGLMVQAGLTQTSFKLALVSLFMLFTSPTASHALARAALHAGHKPQLDDTPEEKRSNR